MLNLPKITKRQNIGQLYGSSLSLAIAQYCQEIEGVKLLIAPDHLIATQLADELEFFLKAEASPQPILFFPDWETLPYDQFSPHQDIISERLATLSQLQQLTNAIVITAVNTLMQRLSPLNFVHQYTLSLSCGQSLNLSSFRNQLQNAGYFAVNRVLEHGEYAIRGSILDLYPMGSSSPYRIELFDDCIESLREFDPETQRTCAKLAAIQILPAREFPLTETSITLFRRQFREKFTGNPSRCPLYEAISEGKTVSGIEYYLPLFFEQTNSFFDYLPSTATILLIENTLEKAELFWQEITVRYNQRSHDITRPILPTHDCFFDPIGLLTEINLYSQARLSHEPLDKKDAINLEITKGPQLPLARQHSSPLAKVIDYLQNTAMRYLFVVESAGRREVLLELFRQSGLTATVQESFAHFLCAQTPVNITTGRLVEGFELPSQQIALIVESQLFGDQAIPQRRSGQKTVDPDLIIRDLAELQINTPVVHLDYGVGRYQGLTTIDNNGVLNEFLILSYADEAKIYVPVTSLHVISRYTGADSDHAPLHRLGTDRWQKDKKKAAEKIHDVAIELLDLYSKRQATTGLTYDVNQEEYHQFAAGFPFTETQDQLNAIKDILEDLHSPKPMDRLICGDVGFGKTEVAMRAAFVATQNNKQVCVLAPTTLLVEQHYETFRDRFADFPIQIDLLSRFRSSKDCEQVIDKLKAGKIDIIIGTHKLFSSDIAFKDLSLLIIDEEHRFGVKQKEKLKTLRTQVDVLSLTATPIPRTLNMAMAGIRDVSLISTPPAKRLAIKTFWIEKEDSIIREAILREILRGGQVFFLHNNIQTIERTYHDLQTLVPEANVQFAHGQMRERQLEKIMSDFYHHRFNVLVCTTIIETGIDIPTANTIIMDRADKFGLAQLHQLRGRVGRSHHQAYAYLVTPPKKLLTADALKRLEALVSLEDLGAGFALATHDLEIRGAGDLLGEEQSGNIEAIGFTLFMDLLDKAVHDLKAGKTPDFDKPLHHGPDIDLRMSALIPDDYIPDVHTRLILYKRIANAKDEQELQDVHSELVDRFGLLPEPAKRLLFISGLKHLALSLGIKKIQATEHEAKIDFEDSPNINTAALIKLIQLHASHYQMEGPKRLKFKLEARNPFEKILEIKQVLTSLTIPPKEIQ